MDGSTVGSGLVSEPVTDGQLPTRRRRTRIPRVIARTLRYLKREVEAYDVEQWKRNFGKCGVNVSISPRCSVWGFEGLQVGDNSCIHEFTHIFASGGVAIGRNAMIYVNCRSLRSRTCSPSIVTVSH